MGLGWGHVGPLRTFPASRVFEEFRKDSFAITEQGINHLLFNPKGHRSGKRCPGSQPAGLALQRRAHTESARMEQGRATET